jgi:hypothetical protein
MPEGYGRGQRIETMLPEAPPPPALPVRRPTDRPGPCRDCRREVAEEIAARLLARGRADPGASIQDGAAIAMEVRDAAG